jgi:LysM repeat protein
VVGSLHTDLLTTAIAAALLASACQGDGPFEPPRTAASGLPQRAYVPPTRSIYEATLDEVEGARQLGDVVRDRVFPSEAVIAVGVARNAQGGPGVSIQMVQEGDSLTRIAAAHGVTLADLESANQALGPAGGRDWNLIHPGERVSVPGSPTVQLRTFTNSRLPGGPPPPPLIVSPSCSDGDTSYVQKRCHDQATSDARTNAERVRAWSATAAARVGPARADLLRQLRDIASQVAPNDEPVAAGRGQAFSDAVEIAATNLAQLPAPRVLLLAAIDDGERPALQKGELDGINAVVTGPSTPAARTWWEAAGMGAGARSVHVLDATLTQQLLAQTVNGAT